MNAQTLPSVCPLDCPDHCSLDVTVEHGRVVRIEGSDQPDRNPVTRGFICSKVRNFARHVYSDARIAQPAIRRGAKGDADFEPISWDEALDRIAEQMRSIAAAHGAEAIVPFAYGGSNGMLTQGTTDARLFRRFGCARIDPTVCAAATSAAAKGLYGKMPGVAYEDFVHARLIVVWGANPSVSGIHLVPIIQEAQRRGAKLVVVDPRETPLAKKADLHLAVRPGTDLPVALALHRHLLTEGGADHDFLSRHTTGVETLAERAEPWTIDRAAREAGVAAADLHDFARSYASTRPAVIRCGWGPERNRNGGSAITAILALPAVAGHFGQRGAGFMLSNSSAWPLDTDPLVGTPEPDTRLINMNRLGRVLCERPVSVHMLFVYNANPLASLPEQNRVRRGLAREDLFTVVYDPVLTDTARWADMILPATTFLEHHEISSGYGATSLQRAEPVIAPVGEARPNHDVFGALCDRLDLTQPGEPTSMADFATGILETAATYANGKGDIDGPLPPHRAAFPPEGQTPIPFVDLVPRTDDHKVHLVPEALEREAEHGLYRYQPDPATERFPLALVSPATQHRVSTILGQLRRHPEAVLLHPDDAAARGIAAGDAVRVWNDLGEVHCPASISRDLRTGVAFLPKGAWLHQAANDASSNALVPDTYTDVAGGACFNDARVQVEKRVGE